MALVLADRVRETTTTTGTGSVTLAGAYTGFQTFSAAVGNTNSTYYTIANVGSGEWEVGIGTYSSGGNLLSRTTVLSSSNGGSLVNFGAGAKDVFVTQPAERALYVASAGTGLESQVTAFTNGGIVYASSTSALSTSSALVFDGTLLGVGVTPSAVQGRIQINGAGNSWFKFYDSTAGFNFGTFYKANGTTALAYLGGGTSAIAGGTVDDFVIRAEGNLLFATGGGTEKMRLDSSGNLLVGTTTSNSAKVTISNAGAEAIQFYPGSASNDNQTLYYNRSASVYCSNSMYAADHRFYIGGAEKARIDSSGNLGLGVTPSAWSLLKGLQTVGGGFFGSNSNSTFVGANWYYDGANKYIANGFASRYITESGTHAWYSAPSGTAGNAITFTQAMTLDASGNLGVGITSPTSRLHVSNTSASSNAIAQFTNGTTGFAAGNGLYVGIDSTNTATIYNFYNSALQFGTNGILQMVLSTTGNLGLGVISTPGWGTSYRSLDVRSNGASFAGGDYSAFVGANIYNDNTNWRYKGASYKAVLYSQFNGTHTWSTDNGTPSAGGVVTALTSAMTLDASGNLVVGDTSATYRFNVRGATGENATLAGFTSGTNTGRGLTIGLSAGGTAVNDAFVVYNSTVAGGYAGHIWQAAGTERARIDQNGNLGLGVTPSAWVTTTTSRGMQFGRSGSIFYSTDQAIAVFGNNYCQTGAASFTYLGNGFASRYTQGDFDGFHAWFTSPSGTAGNAITFTQAMTLDASGNLLVGSTNNNATAGIIHGQSATNSTAVGAYAKGTTSAAVGFYCKIDNANALYAYWNCNGVNTGTISTNGTITVYGTTSDYRLKTVIGNVTGHGERIDLLKPTEYTWNSNGSRTRGFLAHEFQEVYADSVTGTKDAIDDKGSPKYQAMQAASSEVIADLVAEIQSLRKRLASAGI